MDFSGTKILCVGDIMLDRFAYCAAERISPEAPVPVLRLQRTQAMLGGAGNVARNITTLGGTAILAGLIGRDAAGAELRALIRDTPHLVDAHVASQRRPTICKTRFLAAHQQIVRVDEESLHDLDEAEARGLLAAIDERIAAVDAVVLSDYGKRALGTEVVAFAIGRARARGIPVFVDPKSDDFARYRGATCVTPNAAELALAARLPTAGDEEIVAAARKVMADAEAAAILATRSEKGMVLVEAAGAVHHETARAREVYDVSGAGDTVIAVLALAHAAGYSLPQAMRLANTAAGIVISKLGTATVEIDELMLELARDVRDKDWHKSKHYTTEQAEMLVRSWKGRGLRVGFTNGCFDIVHRGHVALLAGARAECDRLIVALNDDASVERLKGPGRPVNPLLDRVAVIAACESVDAVVSFGEDTPLELIRRLLPEVLIKGGDYTDETVVGAAEVREGGGRMVLIDLVEGQSTTRTIARLRAAR
ncbi:MAG: D-glycero-beta-D-manno-heptose-7-phosphate kinase [Alphaproteobacteria bacterium]|nr:D-glycero-beta-D-manno-heptose-7-phosphate kinase [Alphaproteobacteria bacterium]MBV9860884.1 D-glycero-beta-D-manno-heptose-7-phosphate kinase [Alphaproteobacteria bacterium]